MARRPSRRSVDDDKALRYSVRQNEVFNHIRWARAATKHRVSKERSRRVVEVGTVFEQAAPSDDARLRSDRFVFLGRDDRGGLLGGIGVGNDNKLPGFPAMPIRPRYRKAYEEARRWKR